MSETLRKRHVFCRTLAFSLLFLALAGASALPAPMEEGARPEAERIIASLQEKYEGMESLRAFFEQKNELRTLGRTTTARGRLLLQKPGRLRLEYQEPEEQVLVSDGETFWLYTARFRQVMVSRPGRTALGGPAPLLFLAGKGDLRKNFDVVVEEVGVARRGGGVWRAGHPHRIRLEPKSPGASFRRMWLEVEAGSFAIRSLAYEDNLGNKSRLRFSNLEEGVRIASEEFRFTAPPDVEVVRMPGRQAGGR